MRKLLFIISMVTSALTISAQENERDAFVLDVNGVINTLPFELYDRITFNDKSLVISSTENSALPSFEISYEDGVTIGTTCAGGQPTAVGRVMGDGEARLVIDDGKLRVSDSGFFAIAIYSMAGVLQTYGVGYVGIDGLNSGTYIAVATDGNTRLSMKFAIK